MEWTKQTPMGEKVKGFKSIFTFITDFDYVSQGNGTYLIKNCTMLDRKGAKWLLYRTDIGNVLLGGFIALKDAKAFAEGLDTQIDVEEEKAQLRNKIKMCSKFLFKYQDDTKERQEVISKLKTLREIAKDIYGFSNDEIIALEDSVM